MLVREAERDVGIMLQCCHRGGPEVPAKCGTVRGILYSSAGEDKTVIVLIVCKALETLPSVVWGTSVKKSSF